MANISYLHHCHRHNNYDDNPHRPHLHNHDQHQHQHHLRRHHHDGALMQDAFEFQSLLDERDDESSDPESVIINGSDLAERGNQIDFLMDLFQQQVEQSPLVSDSIGDCVFGVIEDCRERDLDNLEPEGLEFRDLSNNDDNRENNDYADNIVNGDAAVIVVNNDAEDDDDDSRFVDAIMNGDGEYGDEDDGFFVERKVTRESESVVGVHSNNGFRFNGFESDPDIEENHNCLGVCLDSRDLYVNNDYCNDDKDEDDASFLVPLCWDSLQLDDRRESNEDFEWEEVDSRVDEREILSVFVEGDDEEATASLSVSPDTALADMVSLERGTPRNLEWEVLLSANNLDSLPDQDHNGETYFGDHDYYTYTAEYEMFGQFVDIENASTGRPPAAKSVLESLPCVVLTKEDLDSDDALCAVCKDEMGVGQRAKQLPCTHRYHGDCILPWLGIRNTCPVCRFELPTDDDDYERRKATERTVASRW